MALSRRAILAGGLGAVVVGGIAIAAPVVTPHSALTSWLRSQLPGLEISAEDLDLFADDFLARWELSKPKQSVFILLMDRPFLRSLAPASVVERYERQSRAILTRFLLSTTMFDEDWDGRTLEYVSFNDPFEWGCANIVAQFVDA